jgi:hypothetical protein
MLHKEVFEAFIESGLFKEVDHNEFSKVPCEVCDSRLRGERWQINGYTNLKEAKDPGNLRGLSICRDCYDKLYDLTIHIKE